MMHIKPSITSKNKEVFELVHLKMRVTKKLMRSSNSKYSLFDFLLFPCSKLKHKKKNREKKKKKEEKKSRKVYNVQESFIVDKKVL